MPKDTIAEPPLDYAPEDDGVVDCGQEPPRSPLLNATIAGAIGFAAIAALIYAPWLCFAFLAGAVLALWATSPALPE